MKLKLIALALAFAAAGQAHAAGTVDFTSGDGNLFLSVWDPVAQTSYSRDLGIDLNTFAPNATLGATPTFNSQYETAGYTLSFTADATLQQYLSSANTANLVWNIGAGDNQGSGKNGYRFLSTSPADFTAVSSETNPLVKSISDNVPNAIASALAASGTSSLTANANSSYVYAGDSTYANNWGSNTTGWLTTGALGGSSNFYFMTPSSSVNLPTTKALVHQFGYTNAQGQFEAATWTLGANGTLTYAVPAAPVPEPESWAMLGVGLGLLALRLRRRA